MLIEQLKLENFKNEKVFNLVEALLDLEQEFVDKKQGNVLSGHLLSISNTFREDQQAIYAVINGGNAAKTRNTKPRTKVKEVKKSRTNVNKYDDAGNCTTCGGTTVSPADPKEDFSPPEDTHKAGGAPTDLTKLKIKTFREILNAFNSDASTMKVVMKLNGIAVGNLVKPEALAKKIFKYMQNEGLIIE